MHTESLRSDSLAGLGYVAVAVENQTVVGIYRVAADSHPSRPDCVTVTSQGGVSFPLRAALARQLCRELPAAIQLGDFLADDGESLA